MTALIARPTIEPRPAPRFVKADYGMDPSGTPSYTPGDHIVLLDSGGAPSLYHINSIDSNASCINCERVDQDLQPTGQTLTRALSDTTGLGLDPAHFAALQPAYMINSGGADDYSVKADADKSKFAYTPDDTPSHWKLPINDAAHIKLAWQAVTKGIHGNKAQLPSGKLAGVKAKIKAAANALPDGDVKKAVLAYINGKSATKSEPEGTPIRERNIAVKAIGDDGWRVGGYLVLWGNENLTDVTGDWFTKSTDFKLDWYGHRPFLYEHGTDKTIKTTAVGTIDTLESDDYGLWMEAQLDRANRYSKRVSDLVKSGKLGLSSGSLPHLVHRRDNKPAGEITDWPIGEGSGTVTPAEPRTIGVTLKHYIGDISTLETAYKSIGQLADKWLEGLEQEATGENAQDGANGSNATGTAADSDAIKSQVEPPKETEEAMGFTDQELTAIAEKMVALQKAAEPPAPVSQPTKSLPASNVVPPPAPVPQPEVKTAPAPSVRVIGDRRFSHLQAEDVSIYTDLMGGVLDRLAMKRQARFRDGDGLKPLEADALKFYRDLEGDPDHKMQRMICDKVLRGVAENRIEPEIVDYLPFATKSAIEGNQYDPTAVKFAQEERLVTRLTDQGMSNDEIQKAVKNFNFATKSNELDSTGQASFGAEWVATIWNNQAWRRVRINNVIAGQMMTVQMPSNPWNWPIESTDPTVFYVAEGTDASQLVLGSGNALALSKAGTGKVTFTAKKLGAHIGFSVEENEDSIIPIIPIWRYQVTRSLANYVDDTIINGDTTTSASTNINLIDATPAAGTSYLAMDGMRKYCLITNTGQLVDFGNVGPTMANFRVMQTKLLGAYQADIQSLMYVVNVATWQKMKAMPEFAAYLNSGVPPTPVTGLLPNGSYMQVGSETASMPIGYIDGIPVYVSAQIGLAQSGAIGSHGGEISTTGSNNTTGSALLFHRSRAVLGYRRPIGVDVLATSVFSDTFQVWGTVRFAFNTFDTQSIALGYDIAN